MTTDATRDSPVRWRLVMSTVSNYLSYLLTLGVWFFLTPFLIHQLGSNAYGLWILVGSVVAYGALLDLGIAPAVTKYVAEYRARGQIEQAQSLVATALWLYTGLGLVAMLLSAILAPIFPLLFNIPVEQHNTASWLVLLSGISLGVALPSATSSAVLSGLQRFDLKNLISISGTALFAASTVAVLLLGGGVLGMVAVNIPITLLMQIPTVWIIYRIAPELRFGWRGAQRRLVRTVFSFSSALVAIDLAGQIQTKTDEIVIGAFLPVASVTPYSIARRLGEMPQTLTYQFVKVLMPLASHMHATDERHKLTSLYLTSTRLTLALDVPLICGLAILSRRFLSTWVGPEYGAAAPLVTILASASLLNTLMWPAGSILQGMARHRPLAIFAIGSAIINLLLSIWLIHPLGVTGVALGTLIPTSIECVCFVTPYAMRENGVSLRSVIRDALGPGLLPAVPMLGVLVACRQLLQPESYLAIGAIGLVGVLVYSVAYLALCRGKPEQEVALRLVRQLIERVRTRTDLASKDATVSHE